MASPLFEDIFTLTDMDVGGKKFDKVSRIVAHSEQFDMDLVLDVNSEIYPMRVGNKFTVVMLTTLNLDGTPDTGFYLQTGRKSLADKFEYIMHGKLYKMTDSKKNKDKLEIYASFGGLLMQLTGEASHMSKFELDQRFFLCMRKVVT